MLRMFEASKSPMTGMELQKLIASKTPSKWTPSPGSIYPLLNTLEKDALIYLVDTGDRKNKSYMLSETGIELIRRINEESLAFKPNYEHLIHNKEFLDKLKTKLYKLTPDELENRIKSLHYFSSILEEIFASKK